MANAHSGISFNVHSYFMIVSILFSNHSMTDCHPHKIGSCYSPMETPLSSLRPQIAAISLFL